MIIKSLKLENFRNLAQVEVAPHPSLNLFFGANGAGKTSVLEAVVVLSRGRSFRTTLAAELIGQRGPTFRIFAHGEDEGGRDQRLGLERSGKRWRGRRNGRDLSQLSELTRCLPVVLVEPDSHLLVSGSPEVRRKFLDWGMFHVKREFLEVWRRYAQALRQRNAALRLQQSEVLDSLDAIVADQGSRLSEFRQAHASAVAQRLQTTLEALDSGLARINIEYHAGWTGGGLGDVLRRNRGRDLERGLTTRGPHRADLDLRCGDASARSILSRGEQKLLAAALLLTQADLLAGLGERPVLLLDDLASEFDEERYRRVLDRALGSGAQVWLTGTRGQRPEEDCAMFHVEQGQVAEML